MKYGCMYDFRQPIGLASPETREFYPAMFDQIAYIDQAGFDSVWITEHHFVEDGYLAASMPMLAAIAARTRNVKVGSYVILAPFYHPLRLAEEGCDVAVAAKTVEPNDKLPGTVHETAREIEALGRRALPLQVDVREDATVERAVKSTLDDCATELAR